MGDDDTIDFTPVEDEVDKLIKEKQSLSGGKNDVSEFDRVSFAHEIKKHPPKPGFMETEVKPGIYSIDLNVDAHWWFSHVCTVFPLLLDQAKRTHIDLKDSFKEEKRLPDFNMMFIVVLLVGLVGVVLITKFFGWW